MTPRWSRLGLITAAFVMLGRLHRAFGVAPMGPKSHAVLADGAGAAAGKDI
jgi:hypothetical protein